MPTTGQALTTYLANALGNEVLRNVAFAQVATVYSGLIAAPKWAASTAYALNAYVLPTTRNGRIYRATVAGTSAASEPTWPTTDGGTVVDGGVTWTEQTTAMEGGTVSEVSGNGYARQTMAFNAPSGVPSVFANTSNVDFPVATPSGWNTVAGFVLADALSAGNILLYGMFTAYNDILAGNQFRIAAGALTVTWD